MLLIDKHIEHARVEIEHGGQQRHGCRRVFATRGQYGKRGRKHRAADAKADGVDMLAAADLLTTSIWTFIMYLSQVL